MLNFVHIDFFTFSFWNVIKTYFFLQVNDANLVVQDSMGNVVESQHVELDNITGNLRNFYVKAYTGISPKQVPKYWLFFRVSVPPLGWNTYFISKASQKGHYPELSPL